MGCRLHRSYRPTIASAVAYGVLKIPYIKTVYDPKFVSAPNHDYFLKSGNYFSTDHLPALPMWQLMNHEMSVEDFRTDSTFYYMKKKEDILQTNNNTPERLSYYRLDLQEKQIFSGREVYEFNRLNQFNIALSYHMEARLNFEELLEYESKEIDEYQQVLEDARLSVIHADSMLYYLTHEYRSLNRAYKAKKDIHRNYTREYRRYTEKIGRSSTSNDKKIEMMRANLKKYQKQYEEYRSDILGSTDFAETEFRHKGEPLDSFNLSSYKDSVWREFKMEQEQLETANLSFAEQDKSVNSKFIEEQNYLDSLKSHFEYLFQTRRAGYDDYDFQITGKKLSFQAADSNLYFGEVFFIDSLRNAFKTATDLIKKHIKTTKTMASSLKKLKRMQRTNSEIGKEYDDAMGNFDLDMERSQNLLKEFDQHLVEYTKSMRIVEKKAKKALKIIELEMQVEYDKSPYKARIRAHKRLAKDLLRENRRLIRKTERKIQKLD